MIRLALEAGLTPGPLPFDFDLVRQKAIEVLEYALGKKLVPREEFDQLMQRSVQQHDDMMFDRLGKMEHERTKLAQEKAESVKFKQAIDQVTSEKLLTAALNLERQGFVQIRRCRSCGRTLAAAPAGARCTVQGCPYCGYDRPQQ
jgi:rubrerythrin